MLCLREHLTSDKNRFMYPFYTNDFWNMLWHGRSLSFKQGDEHLLEALDVCFFWTCVISRFFFFLCVLVKDLQIVELALHIILLWRLSKCERLAYLMFWLWVAPAGNSEERWSYSPHLPSPGHTHTWAHYCTPTAQTHTQNKPFI